jgi:hypothetical protein
VGKLKRGQRLSQIFTVLALTQSAGISFLQGLESVEDTLNCPLWRQRIQQVHLHISHGAPIWQALERSGGFTTLCLQLIRTGEASGSLDTMLENLARHHSEQTHYQAENLATLLEPALLLITGTIVGVLVVAMYLPIFHLGDAISGMGDKCWRKTRQHQALQAVEHAVLLFLHANKGRTLGQLFQARGAHVGAGRTQAAEDIASGVLYRSTQRQLNGFAFRRAILRNAANVARHRRFGAHAVEQHEFLAVFFNDGTAALFMAGQHTASITKSAPPPKAFATSPGIVQPPSLMIWPPRPCAASAHSITADSCG